MANHILYPIHNVRRFYFIFICEAIKNMGCNKCSSSTSSSSSSTSYCKQKKCDHCSSSDAFEFDAYHDPSTDTLTSCTGSLASDSSSEQSCDSISDAPRRKLRCQTCPQSSR